MFLSRLCRPELRLQLPWVFVNLQVGSMDTTAILSTHARLARCPLRPSPPARRRRLSIEDTGQLPLPFLTESEIFAPTVGVDHTGSPEVEHDVRSNARRSREKTFAPPIVAIEKARASDRNPPKKTAKRKPPAAVDVPADSKLLVSRKAAAVIVSLSLRKIDGLLASKQLPFRKIGTRTLVPLAALQRFARMDHPERIAS